MGGNAVRDLPVFPLPGANALKLSDAVRGLDEGNR